MCAVIADIEDQGERLKGQPAGDFFLVVATQRDKPHVHGFGHRLIIAGRPAS
jgi:hypothetical protein